MAVSERWDDGEGSACESVKCPLHGAINQEKVEIEAEDCIAIGIIDREVLHSPTAIKSPLRAGGIERRIDDRLAAVSWPKRGMPFEFRVRENARIDPVPSYIAGG